MQFVLFHASTNQIIKIGIDKKKSASDNTNYIRQQKTIRKIKTDV